MRLLLQLDTIIRATQRERRKGIGSKHNRNKGSRPASQSHLSRSARAHRERKACVIVSLVGRPADCATDPGRPRSSLPTLSSFTPWCKKVKRNISGPSLQLRVRRCVTGHASGRSADYATNPGRSGNTPPICFIPFYTIHNHPSPSLQQRVRRCVTGHASGRPADCATDPGRLGNISAHFVLALFVYQQ